MKPMSPRAGARPALLAALLVALGSAACAHGSHAIYDQANPSMETPMSQAQATTTVEGDGVRLEASFDHAAGGPLRVRYRVHNTGSADLAVFDRGDRHAVLTGRHGAGEVGDPGFREDGQGGLELRHAARPLPQPAPTLPPTPLAARVAPGQLLEGHFSFSPLVGDQPRRLRWCLGVAPFNERQFRSPDGSGDVEVWQASFELSESQQLLCTPWFDAASGTFAAD